MDLPHQQAGMTARDERAHSLAHRMVAGSAAASMIAYRMGEGLELVAHGYAHDGALVMAAVPVGLLASTPSGHPIEVRMDLVKQSPDPSVSLIAASAHFLATLTWAGAYETAARRREGLPAAVDAMLEAPGARLGFLEADRLSLHDLTGVSTIPLPDPQPTIITDGHAAFSLVAPYDDITLKDLCWSVMVGCTPGVAMTRPPLPMQCHHTTDRVFCVDIDPHGVTVMLVGHHETLTVFAAFQQPVRHESELPAAVNALFSSVQRLAA